MVAKSEALKKRIKESAPNTPIRKENIQKKLAWTNGQKVMVKDDRKAGLWYLAIVSDISDEKDSFRVRYPGQV